MKEKELEGILICIDFDGTFIKGHFHAYAVEKKIMPFSEESKLIVNGKIDNPQLVSYYDPKTVIKHAELFLSTGNGIKSPKEVKESISLFMKKGASIAITSFNLYPDSIKYALEKIGFSEKELKNINVICGMTVSSMSNSSKKDHIDKAMELVCISDYKNVILIDDDREILSNAAKLGLNTIYALKREYIKQLKTKIDCIKAANEEKQHTDDEWPEFSSTYTTSASEEEESDDELNKYCSNDSNKNNSANKYPFFSFHAVSLKIEKESTNCTKTISNIDDSSNEEDNQYNPFSPNNKRKIEDNEEKYKNNNSNILDMSSNDNPNILDMSSNDSSNILDMSLSQRSFTIFSENDSPIPLRFSNKGGTIMLGANDESD